MGRKKEHPKDTEYFTYDNRNPKDKKTSDCAIRAIACALDKPWEEVFDALCVIAKKKCTMPNDPAVYEKYLNDNGWKKHKSLKHDNGTRYTINEFCDYLPSDAISIVHVSKHLTCIKDKKIHDSWNCSSYSAGIYYTK